MATDSTNQNDRPDESAPEPITAVAVGAEVASDGTTLAAQVGETAPPPLPKGGPRSTVGKVVTYLVLSALSLVVLFPIYMLILRALSSPLRYIAAGQPLYPVAIQWDVFSNAFTQANLGRAMALSFVV